MPAQKPAWADGAMKQGFSLIELGKKGPDETDEWLLTRALDPPIQPNASDKLDDILFNPHSYLTTALSAIYKTQPLPNVLDVQILYQKDLAQPWVLVMHADVAPHARVALQVLLPWGMEGVWWTRYWSLPDPRVPNTTYLHMAELEFPLGAGTAKRYPAHLHFGNDLDVLAPAMIRWMILQPDTFFDNLNQGRLWEIIQVEKYFTPWGKEPERKDDLMVHVDSQLKINIQVGRSRDTAGAAMKIDDGQEPMAYRVQGTNSVGDPKPLSAMDGVSGCAWIYDPQIQLTKWQP